MAKAMSNDVRRRRRELDLTQAQLAEKVGIARQTLIAIEIGGNPSLATAMRLARALRAGIDQIFPIHAAMADQPGDDHDEFQRH